MATKTSHNHIDPHALDSLLQSTLQLHRTHLCNTNNGDTNQHRYPSDPSSPSHPTSSYSPHGATSISPRALRPNRIDLPPRKVAPPPPPPSQDLFNKESQPKADLKLGEFLSSSSTSSNSVDGGTETPLSSALISPTRSTTAGALPFSSCSPPPPATFDFAPSSPILEWTKEKYYSSLSLLSCSTSPTNSTSTPTSPLRKAFSSPRNHQHDPLSIEITSTTFSAYYNQLSPDSKQQYAAQKNKELQYFDRTTTDGDRSKVLQMEPGSPLRNDSCSQHFQPATPTSLTPCSHWSPTTQQLQQQPMQLNKLPYPRRIKTSISAMSSSSINYSNTNHLLIQNEHTSLEHNGSISVQHPPGNSSHLHHNHQNNQHNGGDPKIDTTSVIPIHVRYVTKDLWVQVDLPRDMPVHKARDLILAKCRLTSLPAQPQLQSQPQPLQTAIPQSTATSEVTLMDSKTRSSGHDVDGDAGSSGQQRSSCRYVAVDSPSISNGSSLHALQLDGNSTPICSSRRLSRIGGDDESINDQESIGDDEAELQAEELMADDIFSQSLPSRSSSLNRRITGGAYQRLQGGSMVSSRSVLEIRRCHSTSIRLQQRPSSNSSGNGEQAVLNQQQLRRLKTYSSPYMDDSIGYGSAGERGSKDSSGSSRFSNIPGWSHYRSRQSTTSARTMVREVLDHGGVLNDCFGGDAEPQTEIRKSECSAWKACFGLFWVAAGHWLDDSRLISSYNLQPHCLLELQLRNNYIQLPPPGTPLNYYDHYAEGVLYKMSKKCRPISKLTNNGATDCPSVWKERWVVLQGTKLLIYHKRKDTTTKSIELPTPLSVVTTILPHIPRHSFKLMSSAVAMSTTMITLTISPDPSVSKVCFRATSESELNHWARIFNSLSCTPLQGLPPPFDPTAIVSPIAPPIIVPPPLPPLPLEPPPASMDEVIMSTKKRNRHHSYTAANNYITMGAAFSGGRQRSHTVHTPVTLSAINPVLISNAAAALLNLSNHNQSTDDDGSRSRLSVSNSSGHLSVSNSSSRSSSIRRNGQVTNGKHQSWNSGQETLPNLAVSLLDGRDLLQQHSLSRQVSFSAHYQNFGMEGEQRRRMATDPGHGRQMPRIRSLSYRGSSQQLPREYSLRSKVTTPDPLSEITSIPENVLLENEEHSDLDPSSMKLLKSSNQRSSAPLLYSGYTWLYIPNKSASIATNSNRASVPPMSRSSSSSSICVKPTMTSPSGSRAANISISKASGRYVKCFVAINALGQFQWVEVKKELDVQQEGAEQDSASNTSFGIQLDAKVPSSRHTKVMEHINPGEEERYMEATITAAAEQKKAGPVVQVSMAHKLRLYFFCIKISLSALMEVMVEMVPEPEKANVPTSSIPGSSPPPLPPPLNKKSSLRVLNRYSAPLMRKASTLSTSSSCTLLPQPVRSTSLTRTRALSGTPSVASQDFLKNNTNAVWPSMHPLHEKPLPPAHTSTTLLLRPPPPMSLERLVPKSYSVQSPSTSAIATDVLKAGLGSGDGKMPRSLLLRTQSLFAENRTRSSLSVPILPSVMDPTAMPRTCRSSLSTVFGRTTGAFYPPTPDTAVSSVNDKFQESVDPKTTSHVLALAQGLQKAMQSHSSSDVDLAEAEQQGMQQDQDQPQQKHKISLQEITAKKRASHLQKLQKMQDSENVAATRLKLVGGLKQADSSSNAEAEKERLATAAATLKVLMRCPFLEQEESKDAEGKMFVTLKGYTETEDVWKMLRGALERFLDGPIKDQRSALPPEDTLIPSYHAPRLPEVRLSEKAQNFLKAKDRVSAAVASGNLGAGTASFISTTPPAILAASVNSSRTSHSRSRCTSTPAMMKPSEFNRNSVPLIGGVGYGPGRSLVADLDNAYYGNNNSDILVVGRTDGVDGGNGVRLQSESVSATESRPGPCSGLEPFKVGHQQSGETCV